MQTAILKNGSIELELLVESTMLALKHLLEKYPIAFREFVMLCRDPQHQLLVSADKLGVLLVFDGRVNEHVKNVTLSAVSSDGVEMTLGNPRSEEQI